MIPWYSSIFFVVGSVFVGYVLGIWIGVGREAKHRAIVENRLAVILRTLTAIERRLDND